MVFLITETGQQSDKKKSQKISHTVKRCRMHPPAMPPNFKKNGSLLHKIRVFEVSMPHNARTCFVKVGTFCCIGSHIFKVRSLKISSNFPKMSSSFSKLWYILYERWTSTRCRAPLRGKFCSATPIQTRKPVLTGKHWRYRIQYSLPNFLKWRKNQNHRPI